MNFFTRSLLRWGDLLQQHESAWNTSASEMSVLDRKEMAIKTTQIERVI